MLQSLSGQTLVLLVQCGVFCERCQLVLATKLLRDRMTKDGMWMGKGCRARCSCSVPKDLCRSHILSGAHLLSILKRRHTRAQHVAVRTAIVQPTKLLVDRVKLSSKTEPAHLPISHPLTISPKIMSSKHSNHHHLAPHLRNHPLQSRQGRLATGTTQVPLGAGRLQMVKLRHLFPSR